MHFSQFSRFLGFFYWWSGKIEKFPNFYVDFLKILEYNSRAGFLQINWGRLRGLEPNQPHSNPFCCFFAYLPCLAPARLRHLHKTPKQKSWLWGAVQFSGSSFSARQAKSRREYPLVFSRDFPQYWRKAAPVNLSGFNSPLLKEVVL